MNLVTQNQSITMSSREIAELVDSRHDKVKQSIERLAERGIIELPPLGEIQTATKPGSQYIFSGKQGKRDSLIVVAQLCPEFTAKIVDRWQELEEKAKSFTALPDFNNPVIAARAWADQVESRQMAETKLALVAPKAEALDRIADADGTMNLTLAAKALQAQPKKLFNWLREKHWIYRRPGGSGNIAYQDKIQAGLLTHKVTTVQREDGTDKVVEQVLVTGKGLAKLAESFMAKGCAA